MTDQELLELAAKAAGYLSWTPRGSGLFIDTDPSRGTGFYWNPLTDDGDALRLAVKLGLRIEINTQVLGDTLVSSEFYDHVECHKSDPYAATRRAIVRAAAEIGKSVEVTK
jgi:hypothetical protein